MSMAELIQQQMIELMGADDTNEISPITSRLPEGVRSLGELPGSARLQILDEITGQLAPSIEKQLRDTAGEARESEASAESNISRGAAALQSLGIDEGRLEDRVRRAYGSSQDFWLGTGNRETDNLIQRIFSQVPNFLSSDFRQGRDGRQQLSGIMTAEAYDNLRGAGAISNFELASVRPAVSSLTGEPDEETALRLITQYAEMNNLAQRRQARGIRIGEDGTEFERNPSTGEYKRVFSFIDPETNEFHVRDLNTDEVVYNIPSSLSEQEAYDIYTGRGSATIPDGALFVYRGRVMRKGQR